MNKLKILSIFLILTFSCSEDESVTRIAQFETPVLTGFQLRDEMGQRLETIGEPNLQLSSSNSMTSFYFYPNPCTGNCAVQIKSENSVDKKYIWIVKALYNEYDINATVNTGNATTLFIGGEALINHEFFQNSLNINLNSLSDGYYRIYVKVDDEILYDNLILSKFN